MQPSSGGRRDVFLTPMQEKSVTPKALWTVSCVRAMALALLWVGVLGVAWGQGTVKGFLKAEASGEAVMFASVTLEGTAYGVSSDVEGYFSLSRIPSGQYTLVVSSLEYETVREAIEIRDDRVLTKNIFLA